MVLMENAAFNKPDEIMPFFIIKYLPPGIRGLMLAGIFSAAMSTLSSSINALSASTSIDILGIQNRKVSDKEKIKSSRLNMFQVRTFQNIKVSGKIDHEETQTP